MPKKEESIEHDPGDIGYTFAVWTIERLWDHLTKETGVRMSVSRLRAEGLTVPSAC